VFFYGWEGRAVPNTEKHGTERFAATKLSFPIIDEFITQIKNQNVTFSIIDAATKLSFPGTDKLSVLVFILLHFRIAFSIFILGFVNKF